MSSQWTPAVNFSCPEAVAEPPNQPYPAMYKKKNNISRSGSHHKKKISIWLSLCASAERAGDSVRMTPQCSAQASCSDTRCHVSTHNMMPRYYTGLVSGNDIYRERTHTLWDTLPKPLSIDLVHAFLQQTGDVCKGLASQAKFWLKSVPSLN